MGMGAGEGRLLEWQGGSDLEKRRGKAERRLPARPVEARRMASGERRPRSVCHNFKTFER
jgi:hypothetical protein